MKFDFILIIIISNLIMCGLHGQNMGINIEEPQAQLHIKHIPEISDVFLENFESQIIPPEFFSLQPFEFTTDSYEGSYALKSPDPLIHLVPTIEADFSTYVPENFRLRISFWVKYELGVSDDLLLVNELINGPATSSWQKKEFVVSAGSNIVVLQGLFFSGQSTTHFTIDSLNISYDMNEGNTLRIEDSFEEEGYILVSDSLGNATWRNPAITNTSQFLFFLNDQLYITQKPQNPVNIESLKNDNSVLRFGNDYSIHMGPAVTTTYNYGINLGESSQLNAANAFVVGKNNVANGTNSFVGGINNNANSYLEFSIGQFPVLDTSANGTSWLDENYLGVFGNGQSSATRSNAFTVLKNGSVGVGNIVPTEAQIEIEHGSNEGIKLQLDSLGDYWTWTVAEADKMYIGYNGTYIFIYDAIAGAIYNFSDSRLKSNFKNATNALDRLMNLGVYQYIYNQGGKETVGVKAQEIEQYFPDLITHSPRQKGGEDFLAVNYQGLGIYTLKALQEQQVIIENQEKEIELLRKDVEMLKKLIMEE